MSTGEFLSMTFMEENLDYYAQSNGLRDVNSYLKLMLGMGAIFICVASQSPVAPLFILFTLSVITLVFCKNTGSGLWRTSAHSGNICRPLSNRDTVLKWRGSADPDVFPRRHPLTATTGSANLALLVLVRTFGGYVRALLYFPDNPDG